MEGDEAVRLLERRLEYRPPPAADRPGGAALSVFTVEAVLGGERRAALTSSSETCRSVRRVDDVADSPLLRRPSAPADTALPPTLAGDLPRPPPLAMASPAAVFPPSDVSGAAGVGERWRRSTLTDDLTGDESGSNGSEECGGDTPAEPTFRPAADRGAVSERDRLTSSEGDRGLDRARTTVDDCDLRASRALERSRLGLGVSPARARLRLDVPPVEFNTSDGIFAVPRSSDDRRSPAAARGSAAREGDTARRGSTNDDGETRLPAATSADLTRPSATGGLLSDSN